LVGKREGPRTTGQSLLDKIEGRDFQIILQYVSIV
jgi:hypothetical protein